NIVVSSKFIIQILVFFIILSFLTPAIPIGSSTYFRLDRIVQLFTFPILFVQWPVIQKIEGIRSFFVIGVTLLIFSNISDYIGNSYFVGGAGTFPIRSLLMISKVLMFAFFVYIIVFDKVNIRWLFNLISGVFLVGLLVGTLQY